MILDLIDRDILDVEIAYTKSKGEASEIVKQKLKENTRYFIAVGGDGTVNEVARSLINTEGILGIVPVGSGNGLARHLKIPLRSDKAIKVINSLKYHSIDYGLVNNIPFFCTCGVGFDALVGEKFSKSKDRGLSNYMKTTIQEYFRYTPEKYLITINGERQIQLPAFLITFANASQYGNNTFIAPDADIYDGELDLCILSPFKLSDAPEIGIRLFTKKIDGSSLMHIEKVRTILLERESDGFVHFDGEPLQMGKKLEISLIHKGLNVVMP